MYRKTEILENVRRFSFILRAFSNEAYKLAQERLDRGRDERIEYQKQKLVELVNDPATRFVNTLLAKRIPEGESAEEIIEQLEAPSGVGTPAIYSTNRPLVFDAVLNRMHIPIKFYTEVPTSGTTFKKIIYQPATYLLDRMSALYRIAMKYDINISPKNPVIIGLPGAPSFSLQSILSNMLNIKDPLKAVHDVTEIKRGIDDPKKRGEVDFIAAITSYLELALERGLKIAEGATIIYTGEPMPEFLKKKLKELDAKIFGIYSAAEMRAIAAGMEGRLEIAPETAFMVLQEFDPVNLTLSEPKNIREADFKEFSRIYFTPLTSPTVFNVDIGDMVKLGEPINGIPTISYVIRANAYVRNYEIGDAERKDEPNAYLGKVNGFVSPYLRVGIFMIPITILDQVINTIAPKTRFVAIADSNTRKFHIYTEGEISLKEFLETILSREDRAQGVEYLVKSRDPEKHIEIIHCPELVEAHRTNGRRKSYAGIVVKERVEGPYEVCK